VTCPGLVEELVDRDDAFRLVADVHDHFGVGHLEHRALDDFTFRKVAEAVIVKVQQLGELRGVHLLVVSPLDHGRGFQCLPARGLGSPWRRRVRGFQR
jgi:hypothetical protein